VSDATYKAEPDGTFAFRSNGYAWLVVFILCLAQVVSFIDRQVISLLVEPIKQDLGISDTQISLLQGFAFALFYSLVAIPIGRLVDARHRKGIIAIGIALWSIATFACGLAKVFWQLFVGRMFVGIGEATLTPAGVSMLSDYFPRRSLTRALSVFTGAGFLGSGLALILGGLVFGQMAAIGPVELGILGTIRPWQLTFIAVSLPGFFLVIILWLVVREPPRIGAAGAAAEEPLSLKDAWTYVMDHKAVLGPVVIGFTFMAMMMFSVVNWTPTLFVRTFDMPIAEIGGIIGLYFMTLGSAGVVAGGMLSDWLKARGYQDSNVRAGLLAALMTVPFLAAFPIVEDQTLALILLAPVIFFGTMPFGAGPSALPLIVPNRLRGQVMALYLLLGNLIGQGCGPLLVAVFTDFVLQDPAQVRYSISIVCTAIALVGAVILFVGLKPFARHVQAIEANQT